MSRHVRPTIKRRVPSPLALVAGGVGLVAVSVRLPGVYSQPFWQDEVASARILRAATLTEMLTRVGRTESTPPLWYFLGWTLHATGTSLQDVRLLSVAAGGLLAVFVVVLARRFVSLPLAAFAGALVALGGEYVARGQELRSYELFALLGVVLALCLMAELTLPSTRREIGLAAAVAAGGLTHYFFVFSVLASLAWLHLDRSARTIARRATVAIVSGGAVAAIWAPVALRQYHQHRFSWIGPFRFRYVWAVPLRLFTYAFNNTSMGSLLSTVALGGILIGVVKLGRDSPAGRLVAALAVLPVAFAAVAWASGLQIFALRNLISVGPFVAIAIATALSRLPRPAAVLAASALVIGLAVSLQVSTANTFPRFNAIARTLVHDGWRPSDPIVVFGSPFTYKSPLEWYLPRQPLLDAIRASAGACDELFVVSPKGRVRLLRLDEPVWRDRALRHATILVDRAHKASCAGPVRIHPAVA
jgi:uncharacterized membrane protein